MLPQPGSRAKMSRSSFPRPEHIALLREKIAQRLQSYEVPLELAERGVDHYRCCYRFGVRQSPDRNWLELSIHFQLAERLESGRSSAELDQMLTLFLERHFAKDGTQGLQA